MLKGIVLAGGSGSRLFPATRVSSKQLLPIYDKPMIYYPLTTLMLVGIRDILIISQADNLPKYQALFDDGAGLGMQIEYAAQEEPKGIAEALLIADAAHFLSGADRVALILGDNVFHGADLKKKFSQAALDLLGRGQAGDRATIFITQVRDPQRYGVAELDDEGQVLGIAEKPKNPKSSWAVTGLYFYPVPWAVRITQGLKPSTRGELEITDLNRAFLLLGCLDAVTLGRGFAWLDTGTPEALLQASAYVEAIQSRQGRLIGSPEEAAFEQGWITLDDLWHLAKAYPNEYGDNLRSLVVQRRRKQV